MLFARRASAAGGQGFEPRFSGPKPDVLPLDDPPKGRRRIDRGAGRELRRRGETAAMPASPSPASIPARRADRENWGLGCAPRSRRCWPARARSPSAPAPSAPPRPAARARTCPGAANVPAIDAATLCLIDQARATYRLRLAAIQPGTRRRGHQPGQEHGALDYFADVRPSGQTPLSLVMTSDYAAHARGVSVGENIAWGTSGYATPAHIVAAWMASPPHRADHSQRRIPRRRGRGDACAAHRASWGSEARHIRGRVRRTRALGPARGDGDRPRRARR